MGELQYGERQQLERLGMRETPISRGWRPERSAGRPATGTQTAPAQQAPPVTLPSEGVEAMREFFDSERTLRMGLSIAGVTETDAAADRFPPTTPAWLRVYIKAQLRRRDQRALEMKARTPDFDI